MASTWNIVVSNKINDIRRKTIRRARIQVYCEILHKFVYWYNNILPSYLVNLPYIYDAKANTKEGKIRSVIVVSCSSNIKKILNTNTHVCVWLMCDKNHKANGLGKKFYSGWRWAKFWFFMPFGFVWMWEFCHNFKNAF